MASHQRSGIRTGVFGVLCLLVLFGVAGRPALGRVVLVDGRLGLSAAVGTDARLSMTSRAGFSKTKSVFRARAAVCELDATPGGSWRMVLSFDLADSMQKYLQDAFVEFRPSPQLGIRAGQILVPQGYEGMERAQDRRLVEYSPVNVWVVPYDHRDIGVAADLDLSFAGVQVAVFNGNGRNTLQDDNESKDICGRVVARPFGKKLDLEIAARGYLGRLGSDELVFWNVGAETRLRLGRLEAIAEVQNAQGRTPKRSFYVMFSYAAVKLLEPAVRVDMEDLTGGLRSLGVAGGLSLFPIGPAFKLMLDARYLRWFSPDGAQRSTDQRFSISFWSRL